VKCEIVKAKEVVDNLSGKSYADATKEEDNIKSVIKVARAQEREEDHERKKEAKNFIIHGVKEQQHDSIDENKIADEKYVKDLIKDTHVPVTIKFSSRIGARNEDKNRPIKVILRTEDEKSSLMRSLGNLQQYPSYKGISITEDLTLAERDQYKTYLEKANKKNQDESYDAKILSGESGGHQKTDYT